MNNKIKTLLLIFSMFITLLFSACNSPTLKYYSEELNSKEIIIEEVTNEKPDLKEPIENSQPPENFQWTETKIKTYFNLTSSTESESAKDYTLHMLCPKDWIFSEGICEYNGLAMIIGMTIWEIDPSVVLDETAYTYIDRGNGFALSSQKCTVAETVSGVPYVFYQNDVSLNTKNDNGDPVFAGTVIMKLSNKYIWSFEFGEPVDEATLTKMLNSVILD